MSDATRAPTPSPPSPTPPPARGPRALRCPRCSTTIAPQQDWCLHCGVPARTRLAPTPNWRAPIAIVAVLIALAGAALAVAFVQLTRDPAVPTTPPAAAPVVTAAPAAPAAPVTTAAPVDPNAAATATVPGVTATNPGLTTGTTAVDPAASTPPQ